jgi:choline dehydrogenase-like flavoprotein
MLLAKSVRFSTNFFVVSRGMSSDVKKRQSDVVILGGGMVGSTLACAMAASPYFEGRKICLLEGAPKKPYTMPETYSNRVKH